jgi:hypothetical protein
MRGTFMETKMITTGNKSYGTTSRCVLTAALVIAALLMAGCGTKLRGKYSSKQPAVPGSGLFEIEFKSGNKANLSVTYPSGIATVGPTSVELDYEVRGKEVTLKNPQGNVNVVATMTDDGCLDVGGDIGKLCKQMKK